MIVRRLSISLGSCTSPLTICTMLSLVSCLCYYPESYGDVWSLFNLRFCDRYEYIVYATHILLCMIISAYKFCDISGLITFEIHPVSVFAMRKQHSLTCMYDVAVPLWVLWGNIYILVYIYTYTCTYKWRLIVGQLCQQAMFPAMCNVNGNTPASSMTHTCV